MNVIPFQYIIDQIHSPEIRAFTIKCLEKAPPELNVIPASSTGKYHHRDTIGNGGLVVHIQRACYFAKVLMDSMKWEAEDPRGDILLSSLLLHDIGKKEKYDTFFDYQKHAERAANMIQEFGHMIPLKFFNIIHNCIFFHMGPWTNKPVRKPMEKYTVLELLTYQCDYMSSRKDMDINNEALSQ